MTLYEHSSLTRKYAEYEDAAACAVRWANQHGITTAIVRESYSDGVRWWTGYNAMSWDAMLAEGVDPSDIVAFRWANQSSASDTERARRQAQLRSLYSAHLAHDRAAIATALDRHVA